jgi:hypothetical protein
MTKKTAPIATSDEAYSASLGTFRDLVSPKWLRTISKGVDELIERNVESDNKSDQLLAQNLQDIKQAITEAVDDQYADKSLEELKELLQVIVDNTDPEHLEKLADDNKAPLTEEQMKKELKRIELEQFRRKEKEKEDDDELLKYKHPVLGRAAIGVREYAKYSPTMNMLRMGAGAVGLGVKGATWLYNQTKSKNVDPVEGQSKVEPTDDTIKSNKVEPTEADKVESIKVDKVDSKDKSVPKIFDDFFTNIKSKFDPKNLFGGVFNQKENKLEQDKDDRSIELQEKTVELLDNINEQLKTDPSEHEDKVEQARKSGKSGILDDQVKSAKSAKEKSGEGEKEGGDSGGIFSTIKDMILGKLLMGKTAIGGAIGKAGGAVLQAGKAALPAIGKGLLHGAKFLNPVAKVAAAGYAGYKTGELLNEYTLNPIAETLTGQKGATLGSAIYDGVDKVQSLWGGDDASKIAAQFQPVKIEPTKVEQVDKPTKVEHHPDDDEVGKPIDPNLVYHPRIRNVPDGIGGSTKVDMGGSFKPKNETVVEPTVKPRPSFLDPNLPIEYSEPKKLDPAPVFAPVVEPPVYTVPNPTVKPRPSFLEPAPVSAPTVEPTVKPRPSFLDPNLPIEYSEPKKLDPAPVSAPVVEPPVYTVPNPTVKPRPSFLSPLHTPDKNDNIQPNTTGATKYDNVLTVLNEQKNDELSEGKGLDTDRLIGAAAMIGKSLAASMPKPTVVNGGKDQQIVEGTSRNYDSSFQRFVDSRMVW